MRSRSAGPILAGWPATVFALQRSQPLAIEFADPTRDGVTRFAARGYRSFRIRLTSRHGQQTFRLGHLAGGFAVLSG